MAPAAEAAGPETWTDSDFNANTVHVLKVLMVWRGVEPDDLWEPAGFKRSTFYSRMSDGKFRAAELRRLARFLGVRVDVFYAPAEALLESIRTGSFRGAFTIVPGQGHGSQLKFPFHLSLIPT